MPIDIKLRKTRAIEKHGADWPKRLCHKDFAEKTGLNPTHRKKNARAFVLASSFGALLLRNRK